MPSAAFVITGSAHQHSFYVENGTHTSSLLLDTPFNKVIFLTSHNGYAYNTSGQAGFYLDPNQGMSIARQLEHGVRGFTLEVTNDPKSNELIFCHGTDRVSEGCLFYQPHHYPVKPELEVIVSFLNQHPNEIVTLFIDDKTRSGEELLGDLLNSVAEDLLIKRTDLNLPKVEESKDWPTLNTFVKKNKRLLVFNDRRTHNDALFYTWDYIVENHWEMDTDYQCHSRVNSQDIHSTSAPFLMNHFRSKLSSGNIIYKNAAKKDNQFDILQQRVEEKCQRTPTFLAVDFSHIPEANPRLYVNKLNEKRQAFSISNNASTTIDNLAILQAGESTSCGKGSNRGITYANVMMFPGAEQHLSTYEDEICLVVSINGYSDRRYGPYKLNNESNKSCYLTFSDNLFGGAPLFRASKDCAENLMMVENQTQTNTMYTKIDILDAYKSKTCDKKSSRGSNIASFYLEKQEANPFKNTGNTTGDICLIVETYIAGKYVEINRTPRIPYDPNKKIIIERDKQAGDGNCANNSDKACNINSFYKIVDKHE